MECFIAFHKSPSCAAICQVRQLGCRMPPVLGSRQCSSLSRRVLMSRRCHRPNESRGRPCGRGPSIQAHSICRGMRCGGMRAFLPTVVSIEMLTRSEKLGRPRLAASCVAVMRSRCVPRLFSMCTACARRSIGDVESWYLAAHIAQFSVVLSGTCTTYARYTNPCACIDSRLVQKTNRNRKQQTVKTMRWNATRF